MGKPYCQVGALVLHGGAIQFSDHRVEQHLLFAVRIDSHRALFVLPDLVPNRQCREARFVADQIDLERIDYLDIRHRRVGDRHAAQFGRKVDNFRGSRLKLHSVFR